MHIRFIVDAAGTRLWQAEAVRALIAAPGRRGSLAFVPAVARQRRLGAALFAESRLYRRGDDPLAVVAPPDLPATTTDADLVVDLVNALPPAGGLALAVGGLPVEEGAAAAILAGENPLLTLLAGAPEGPRPVGRWRIGVEVADVLSRALAPTLGRAVEMLALAADAVAGGTRVRDIALPSVAAPAPPARAGDPLAFVARGLCRRLRRRLPGAPAAARWHVAWRADQSQGDGLPALAGSPFERLADDGARFYADPFLARRDGRTFLFVEEFPFATGRGVIAAVEMTARGPAGQPAPVLAQDCHLSYPLLIEDGGELFMIPESSERRTVELWRCRRFPDDWEQAAVLLADIDVGDATVFEKDGRWFMLGARRPRWGSSWDGLDLWTAPALAGPWRAGGHGLVKVDVASARPAGHVFTAGGRLVRPFQDSAGGYGAGLGFAEIERCEEDGYGERVVDTLRARPPLRGIHSYNRGYGFEVIDVFAAAPPAEIRP